MSASRAVQNAEQVPINIVGSSTFGIYPKISAERTYNMFISDGWLINYAGFKKKIQFTSTGQGRALFRSIRGGFLIAVEGNSVFRLNDNLVPILLGQLNTTTGFVSIAENLSSQICLVDGEKAYIYNYSNNTFTVQSLVFVGNPVIPNYVSYHNSFFLIASSKTSINPQFWYAFERDTDTTIKVNKQFEIQTKSDFALSVVRLPGRGNNVIVLGSSVAEIWTQVGAEENYRRVQSFNIDNGVVSVETIAASEEFVAWLAQNENNSPVIMVTDGGSTKRISTDGIDHILSLITHPDQSSGFFYRQDGHLFYQLTFYHPDDNLTLIHDFTTNMFFDVVDEKMNYHPARQVVYFNERTYFTSINDASIYEMSPSLITYDYDTTPNTVGNEIPRIRICKSVRKEDSSIFRAGMFTFWIEQGVNKYYLTSDPTDCQGFVIAQNGDFIIAQNGDFIITEDFACNDNQFIPRVDMSFSKNGNQSFSNIVGRELNPAGKYRNQIRWYQMGQANEFTIQLRFWGFQRFVCGNGVLEVY